MKRENLFFEVNWINHCAEEALMSFAGRGTQPKRLISKENKKIVTKVTAGEGLIRMVNMNYGSHFILTLGMILSLIFSGGDLFAKNEAGPSNRASQVVKNENDISKSNDMGARAESSGETEIPQDEISQMTAQDPTLKALEYPELQVQPSASQRLSFEVQNESTRRWLYYWPIQISSLSLLVAQSKAEGEYKNDFNESKVRLNDAVSIARITAAGWLVGTAALSTFYRPYRDGAKQTKFKPKDRKQLLTRERLAEEALEDAAQLTQKLNYISVLTHLGASINLASHSNDNAKPYAIFSAVLSLTPLFFKSSTITVWDRHQTYKKRIYGPLASIHQTVVYSYSENKVYPGIGLTASF